MRGRWVDGWDGLVAWWVGGLMDGVCGLVGGCIDEWVYGFVICLEVGLNSLYRWLSGVTWYNYGRREEYMSKLICSN